MGREVSTPILISLQTEWGGTIPIHTSGKAGFPLPLPLPLNVFPKKAKFNPLSNKKLLNQCNKKVILQLKLDFLEVFSVPETVILSLTGSNFIKKKEAILTTLLTS